MTGFTGMDRLDRNIMPIPECGCWIWLGTVNSRGYGTISMGTRREYVHRLVWRLVHKRPIPKGMVMLHRCDTPLCCNPDHVRPASHRANMHDMVSKDRQATLANGKHWAAKVGYRMQNGFYFEPENEEAQS